MSICGIVAPTRVRLIIFHKSPELLKTHGAEGPKKIALGAKYKDK